MPALATVGAMSVRGFGRGYRYSKPAAIIKPGAGTDGTVTSVLAGYDLAGWQGNLNCGYVYLDAPKTSGKWYWEYVAGAVPDEMNAGVMKSTAAAQNSNLLGAGTLFSFGQGYVDPAWTGRSVSPATFTTPNTGDVMSFALDMDSATKTLKIYNSGVLKQTISWTTTGLTFWPIFWFAFGFPSFANGTIRLGPLACIFSITNYQFL